MPANVQRLLMQRVGLRLSDSDWQKLERLLRARMPRHFHSLADYCASLPDSELAREIENITAQWTPGETFFFRDHGQFDLLRFNLLPELIEAYRHRKTLRLWSAGCATGEEAYSLAMLVDMVMPQRQGWQITILGSDINGEALAKASLARYGRWSFRMASTSLQQRYFHRRGHDWILNDDIRRMVTFHRSNLVASPLPDSVFRDIDLILCRNVVIYFQADAVRAVAAKLAACLAPRGYLVTGHTELMGLPLPELRGCLFPEGLVYQRTDSTAPPPSPAAFPPTGRKPAAPALRPAPNSPRPPSTGRLEVPVPIPAFEEAHALANRGDYQAAEAACQKALREAPLQTAPHFLLAQLAQLRGDYGLAEAQLNRTIYLEPDHVAAYLELAALHERAGENGRALARRRTALDLLRKLPSNARVEPFGASAGQLADWLAQVEGL